MKALNRFLLAILCVLGLGAHAADRPNLIWVMADDLGYGELGCYGQELIRTPHLDRMAQEGLRFTQFYAGATVCAPSRSVLMTGQHHGRTRVRGNAGPANPLAQALRAEDVTVARVLQQAGYATALIGKWGLGDEGAAESGLPRRQGFDYFFGYLSQHRAHNHFPEFLWRNEEKIALPNRVTPVGNFGGGYAVDGVLYADDLFADEALKFIANHQSRPFFLYWNPVIPHANNERNRELKDGAHVPDYGPYAGEDWPAQDKGQAAMITRLDSYVGRLLEQLRRLDLAERTLVIFTSDNGPHNESSHNLERFHPSGPLRGIKRSLTDGGIRVPTLAWWPGRVTAGRVSDHVGYFGDWFATAGELAGAEVPSGLDSLSFVPELLADGRTQPTHEFLYWEFHERGFSQAALYQGRWKGLRERSLAAPLALYDLHNDVGEQRDVAAEHPEVVAKLDAYLRTARSESVDWPARSDPYDLVIYGGTSAGVMAAVQARKMGLAVVLVGPDRHLGGLSSGGLGWTDTGDKSVIGGLAREFYHRIWRHYQEPSAWRWQSREAYGNRGQGTPAIDGAQRTMWIFEPHVAERVFEDLVREHGIPVHRDEWLDRERGVGRTGSRITSIRMLSGNSYRGRMFIDATYEGDLLAAAGVSYHVGREAQSVYGETWNGVQTGVLHHRHHFGVLPVPISPYVVPGDPSSGVLPRISTEPPGDFGQGDHRVQAYCFRVCLTDHPENRIPFPRPEGYDPSQYELLLRIFAAGWRETFDKFDRVPNGKTDTNNHGPMSTDNIGANYDYPEAAYARRREILREHAQYQQGWFYFIANDPRVPEEVRTAMNRWGLARDEFVDNQHWPHQLYVREARRMIGLYVMTENELLRRRPTPDSIGMGSYTIDSHNVQRYITPEGHVQNEGDIGVPTPGPYAIAYGSIVPRRGETENLLVPVCVSSSHIAFGSIRMEPVFMILGQSAATAAALALRSNVAVQEVPYPVLRERLLDDGQILERQPAAQ